MIDLKNTKNILLSISKIFLGVAIVVTLSYFLSLPRSWKNALNEKEHISLIAEIDSPGFFEHNGLYYGFMFDILRDYARYKNIGIKISLASSHKQIHSALLERKADIALSLIMSDTMVHKVELRELDVYDNESYVVVAKQKTKIDSIAQLKELMKNKKVAITASFKYTDFYREYRDTSYGIKFDVCDTLLSRNVARKLAFGKVDFMICSKTTSKLLNYTFKSFYTVFEIPHKNISTFYVANHNRHLYKDFTKWYHDKYVFSEAMQYNSKMYQTNKYMRNFVKNGYLLPYKSASPIDYIFKEVGDTYNIDWKLLSSIAHYESHFNNNAKSNYGAIGIMQIRPNSAKSVGMNPDSLSDMKYNVEVSAKLLDNLRTIMKYPQSDKLTNDQIAILLGMYNAGIGHISDAMRITRLNGGNSGKWEDIVKNIPYLRNEKYYEDKTIVKNGRFVGRATTYYVKNVMTKYEELQKIDYQEYD